MAAICIVRSSNSRDNVKKVNNLLTFALVFNTHYRGTLRIHLVTFCIMLTAFFILCPLGIAALFGFASLVNPRTGRIRGRIAAE